MWGAAFLLLGLYLVPVLVSFCLPDPRGGVPWYQARRDPTGLSPDPAVTLEVLGAAFPSLWNNMVRERFRYVNGIKPINLVGYRRKLAAISAASAGGARALPGQPARRNYRRAELRLRPE